MAQRLVFISGLIELGTGIGLALFPGAVAWLIFGTDLQDVGIVVARIAGIALLSLSIGSAPSAWLGHRPRSLTAMLALNAMLFVYLAVLGVIIRFDGLLFWPAVAVHGVLAGAMALAWHQHPPRAGP